MVTWQPWNGIIIKIKICVFKKYFLQKFEKKIFLKKIFLKKKSFDLTFFFVKIYIFLFRFIFSRFAKLKEFKPYY